MLDSREAAQKYAQALFELGERDGKLDIFSTQLNQIASVFAAHEELRQLIFHPQVKVEAKQDTLKKIFGKDTDKLVMNFLLFLVDVKRIVSIAVIWEEFHKLVNKACNVEEAEVISAVVLSDAVLVTLQKKLNLVTGKEIILSTKIDPSIIGGLIIRLGDKLIDGSVVRQLRDIRSALTSSKLRLG
jgi:F-type H+-transporting ATPase subunit delta